MSRNYIADKSYLLVRCGEDEYKAFYNACLHRGRKLRETRAKGLSELVCAFHGWAWNLDGTIKQVPCAYDYTDLSREEESLPEVKIGRWGRFLFINPDPNCGSFEDHIGDLSTQFEVLPYERRYKEAHVAKVIRANWKLVQEAFMESYHVLLTHPQILTGGANDGCTKYDAFENYSRAIRCGALENEGMPEWETLPTDDTVRIRHPLNGLVYEDLGNEVVQVTTPKGKTGTFTVDAKWISGEVTDANPHLCNAVGGRQLPPGAGGTGSAPMIDPEAIKRAQEKLGNNATPRQLRAQAQREMYREVVPSVADTIPDIELSSAIFLTLFPNYHPWGSFNRINYRFRPNGDNYEECIMECMYLAPIPEDGDYTPVSEIHWLGPDDDWVDAPELGGLAKVFNQDVRNLPHVHSGLKATAREQVRLADYNELKLRHWHNLYGKWVEGD